MLDRASPVDSDDVSHSEDADATATIHSPVSLIISNVIIFATVVWAVAPVVIPNFISADPALLMDQQEQSRTRKTK